MKHVLLRGNLIWKALQQNNSSEFDLLWEILQSSEVQGYITQDDLTMLYRQIASEQDMSAAVTLLCQFRRVLEVYWANQDSPLDVAIADDRDSWTSDDPDSEVPIVSIEGFLERYALDQLYEADLEPFQPGGWYRKWRSSGFDPLLIIPIVLTLSLKSLPELQAFLADLLHIQPTHPSEPQSWQALRSTLTVAQSAPDDDPHVAHAAPIEAPQPGSSDVKASGDRSTPARETVPAINPELMDGTSVDRPRLSRESSHTTPGDRFLSPRASLWKPAQATESPPWPWRSPVPQPRSPQILIAQNPSHETPATTDEPLSDGSPTETEQTPGIGTPMSQPDQVSVLGENLDTAVHSPDTNPTVALGGSSGTGHVRGVPGSHPGTGETVQLLGRSTDAMLVPGCITPDPQWGNGRNLPDGHEAATDQQWVDAILGQGLALSLLLPDNLDELTHPPGRLMQQVSAQIEEAIASCWSSVSPVMGRPCPIADAATLFAVDQIGLATAVTTQATTTSSGGSAISNDSTDRQVIPFIAGAFSTCHRHP